MWSIKDISLLVTVIWHDLGWHFDKRSSIRCLPSSVHVSSSTCTCTFYSWTHVQSAARKEPTLVFAEQFMAHYGMLDRISSHIMNYIWNVQIMKCQKWSSAKVRLNIYRIESREHQLCQNKSKIEQTTFTCQVFKLSDIRSNLKHNRIHVCLVRKIDVTRSKHKFIGCMTRVDLSSGETMIVTCFTIRTSSSSWTLWRLLINIKSKPYRDDDINHLSNEWLTEFVTYVETDLRVGSA